MQAFGLASGGIVTTSTRGLRPDLAAIVTVLAMIGGLMLVSAGSAAAAGRCSVVVPSRLSVDSPVKSVSARLRQDCGRAGMFFASWDIRHPVSGSSGLFVFRGNQRSDSWNFFDWEHLGTYTITPRSASDFTSHRLLQNTTTTTVRLASRVSIRVARRGKFVVLSSTATRYHPSVSDFGPWGGKLVSLGYRTCPTCSWHHIGTRRADAQGRIRTRRLSAPTVREFRARLTREPTTWGSTSGPRRG